MDKLDYHGIIQDALRDVVRRVLAQVAEHGLPGDHYFYIGFHTDKPGVLIPRSLRDRYPQEMTIVLQHQYWDLETDAESFSVTLSFSTSQQRLTIPFAALTVFADPSADFVLQFEGDNGGTGGGPEAPSPGPVAVRPLEPGKRLRIVSGDDDKTTGEVVQFAPRRRK